MATALEPATKIRYATDGTHLYEIVEVVPNAGKTGGEIWVVLDCKTFSMRRLSELEVRTMREVTPSHA